MIDMKFSFKGYSKIREALFSPHKFVTIPAARRLGKTYNSAQWIIKSLLTTNAQSALWVDTKHANIDKYFQRYFTPICKPMGDLCRWDQQKKIFHLPNGKYLDFGSAERRENLEGFQYDLMLVNEAGIVLKDSDLWDDTLQPMSKGKNSLVRFVGTPKGKNKFYKLHSWGLDEDTEHPEYKTFPLTVYDSDAWDHAELENIKKTTPELAWRQNYMAEFIEGEGSVFRNVENQIMKRKYKDIGNPKIMSVDLAKTTDFTVIAVADEVTKEVFYFDRFNKVDWPLQKKRIISTWQKFGKPQLIIDATGVGNVILDDLRNIGMTVIDYVFTASTKNNLIQNLSTSIQNGDISYVEYPILISELGNFEYKVSPSGNVSYNAPSGYHDDCVIALGLANHLLNAHQGVRIWIPEDDEEQYDSEDSFF